MSKIYERLKEPDVWPQDFSNHIKQRHSEVVEMLEDARHRRSVFSWTITFEGLGVMTEMATVYQTVIYSNRHFCPWIGRL